MVRFDVGIIEEEFSAMGALRLLVADFLVYDLAKFSGREFVAIAVRMIGVAVPDAPDAWPNLLPLASADRSAAKLLAPATRSRAVNRAQLVESEFHWIPAACCIALRTMAILLSVFQSCLRKAISARSFSVNRSVICPFAAALPFV